MIEGIYYDITDSGYTTFFIGGKSNWLGPQSSTQRFLNKAIPRCMFDEYKETVLFKLPLEFLKGE